MSRQEPQLRVALVRGAAVAVGAVVAVYLIGLIVTWANFAAARLPGDTVTGALSNRQLFGAGLGSTALTGAAFAVLCLVAYLTATFRWEVNGQEWHDIVRKRGVDNARPDPQTLTAERAARKRAFVQRKGAARSARVQRVGAVLGTHPAGVPVKPPRAKKPAAPLPWETPASASSRASTCSSSLCSSPSRWPTGSTGSCPPVGE
jgi:hypothetical protein